MNRDRTGEARIAQQLEESRVHLTGAELYVLRFATFPNEVLHGYSSQMRLHQIPVDGPCFAALDHGVSDVEHAANLANRIFLDQAVEIQTVAPSMSAPQWFWYMPRFPTRGSAMQCRETPAEGRRVGAGSTGQDHSGENLGGSAYPIFSGSPQQRLSTRLIRPQDVRGQNRNLETTFCQRFIQSRQILVRPVQIDVTLLFAGGNFDAVEVRLGNRIGKLVEVELREKFDEGTISKRFGGAKAALRRPGIANAAAATAALIVNCRRSIELGAWLII